MTDLQPIHSAVAVLATALLFAVPASADVPVRARAMVAPTLGQSVFTDTTLTRTAMRYELEGGVATQGVEASIMFGLTHWLSDRGDLIDKVVVGDTALGGSYELFRHESFSVKPRIDVVLPTSQHSQLLTLWFASHAGFDADASLGSRVRLRGRFRLRRDVHREMTPVPNLRDLDSYADPGPFGFRTAGSHLPAREERQPSAFEPPLGVVVLTPPNVAWGTHLAGQVLVYPVSRLLLDAGLGWTHTWSYKIERPANVIVSEEQPDRLQFNIHTGTFGISWWQPAGPVTIGLRLGGATTGRPKTRDGEKLRFPWWNTEDADYDDSVVDAQLTALY